MATRHPDKAPQPTLVSIRFRVAMTRRELEDAFRPDAPQMLRVPGLRWKIWSFDEANRRFAGTYLFASRAEAETYRDGPVVRELEASPHFSDVRAETYPVLEELSRVTRAPLG